MNEERENLIWLVRMAKRAHQRWVGHALAIIEGIAVERDYIPLEPQQCEFGIWYYGEGQRLRGLQCFRDIEPKHDRVHGIYMEIFKVLFSEKETSLFSRLLGKKSRASREDIENARRMFHSLNEVSRDMTERLDELERVLAQLSEEDFAGLMAGRAID
jgi:hypothetical protein